MPLIINNNLSSINSQRYISKNQFGLNRSLERLSSGLRINKAADDAAGLGISEKLRSNIRALNQAVRNASDGISLIQTAEGALDTINGMLLRMKELSEQAATGSIGTNERGYLDSEFKALRNEITRIADTAKFNDTQLLNGTLNVNLQIGISNSANDIIGLQVSAVSAAALSLATGIATASMAQSALVSTTTAIGTVSSRRAVLGSLQNRLESVVSNLNIAVENLTGAESRIRDVDVAAETAEMTKYNILVQAGVAVLSQANQSSMVALSLLAR